MIDIDISQMSTDVTQYERILCFMFGLDARRVINHLSNDDCKSMEDVFSRYEGKRGIAIIRYRFGFIPRPLIDTQRNTKYNSNYRTLGETSPHFCVTKERIRQIERRTMERLKSCHTMQDMALKMMNLQYLVGMQFTGWC